MGGETKNAKDSELACAGRVRCGLRLMLSHPSLASSLPWANKGVVSHFAKVRKSKFIWYNTSIMVHLPGREITRFMVQDSGKKSRFLGGAGDCLTVTDNQMLELGCPPLPLLAPVFTRVCPI